MKILFPLEYYYPSDIGGPANALYWHTQMLKKNDIDSVIVTSNVGTHAKGVTSNRWIINGNSKLIYCSGGRLSSKIFHNTLKEIGKCDAMHLSSVCYPYNIFFTAYSCLKGKKVIISPRGELFPHAYKSKKAFAKKILFAAYRIFQRKLLFHATSFEEKESIAAIFPKGKIVIQPNLIEVQCNDAPTIKSNDIVFLGRINPIKAIDNLVKALVLSPSFMKSEGKLIIIGSARLPEEIEYKKRIEAIISEHYTTNRVVFVGTKVGDEKFKALNVAKALVLPSNSENFGNVVTEALSQSTPVIASKGTPWQILEEYEMGWWTENTPEALATALDKLYSLEENKYKQFCSNARKYVEENLDIKHSKHNAWPNIYRNIK